MSPVISVSNLSKRYRLGAIGAGTLRGDFERWWARMRGRPDPLVPVDHGAFRDSKFDIRNGEIWALRDVSFEVKQGEVLGIIGRNGAGKSTLLKILSQVTAPTEGCVKIKGRVGSLLEVGTGFHPELTGRENIYLNGAILGMKRAEIDRKFDEIVDFSGVEQFIDTPVKRYSSGMYVRLAFAVAAQLEPEILIVDEVLAVGDAQFQQKCLGKMQAVGKGGRTVLFVSHNLGAVSNLCGSALLLESGRLVRMGDVHTCIARYKSEHLSLSPALCLDRPLQPHKALSIERIRIIAPSMSNTGIISNSSSIDLEITFWVETPGSSYAVAAELSRSTHGVILATSTLDGRPTTELGTFPQRGRYKARVAIPAAWLMEGDYSIRVVATIPCVQILDEFPGELHFTIHDDCSPLAALGEGRRGVLAPRLQWNVARVPSQAACAG
jgi:lipopolysaccharide transport system ATP-binding protein